MKVKVLRRFKDKYTKKIHKKGEIIEVTDERYEEINSTAHGVFVEPVESRPVEDIDFNNMTKKELIEFAQSKGIELDMNMTKKEMIEELM